MIELLGVKGTWRDVADSARTTIGMDKGNKTVKESWKKQILLAEHSPIRTIQYKWKWSNIPYWVSVHFVRHWLGIVHFVKTSRTDRTAINRDELLQNNPISHECEANLQALINISRKRLCQKASTETQLAWLEVVNEVSKKDKTLASILVPECIYRGFCPEGKSSCGYYLTQEYQVNLLIYRNLNI
jgi:hypothetical protein